MRDDNHGAALILPTLDQRDQVAYRLFVYGVEGLVQQDEVSILYHNPCEERPLQLPARQRIAMGRASNLQANSPQGSCDGLPIFGTVAAKQAALLPETKRDQTHDLGR